MHLSLPALGDKRRSGLGCLRFPGGRVLENALTAHAPEHRLAPGASPSMEKTPMAAGLRARRPVDLLELAVARVQDAEESRKSNGCEEISFFLFPHAADACWSCLEPPVKSLCPDSSAPGPNSALTQDSGKHLRPLWSRGFLLCILVQVKCWILL
jgi:hypothetical protein